MKRLLLITFSILLFAVGNASAKSLLLTLTNGKQVYYLLGGEKNPVMKFTDGSVSVNADQYEVSGIKNFVISETDDPDAIRLLSATSRPQWQDDMLLIPSAEGSVRVYSANGTQMAADISETGGNTIVNLNALSQGVYIVKVGNCSFKIAKNK